MGRVAAETVVTGEPFVSEADGYPRGYCSLECTRTCPNRARLPFSVLQISVPDGCAYKVDFNFQLVVVQAMPALSALDLMMAGRCGCLFTGNGSGRANGCRRGGRCGGDRR